MKKIYSVEVKELRASGPRVRSYVSLGTFASRAQAFALAMNVAGCKLLPEQWTPSKRRPKLFVCVVELG
jgi:hypothetical protein